MVKHFFINPTPVFYYQGKNASEIIIHEKYIDIYNIRGLDLNDYDFTNIDYNILKVKISKLGSIPYLQKEIKYNKKEIVFKRTDMVFGKKNRIIFLAVIKNF